MRSIFCSAARQVEDCSADHERNACLWSSCNAQSWSAVQLLQIPPAGMHSLSEQYIRAGSKLLQACGDPLVTSPASKRIVRSIPPKKPLACTRSCTSD